MKTIKILSLVAVALPMAFISCSDDDDNNSAPSADSSVITTTEGNKLLLTSVVNGSSRYDGVWFQYDDLGRCTYANLWGDLFFNMSYDPYEVTMDLDEEGDDITLSMSFNGNGYLSKYTLTDDWTETYYGNEDSGSDKETVSLSYNSNGQLTSVSLSYSGNEVYDGERDSYSGSGSATFTWENGNLVKIVDKITEKEYGYTYTYTQTSTFGYSGTVNKYRQYTMIAIAGDEEGCLADIIDFGFIGYLGVGPTYLPTSLEIIYEDNDDGDVYSYKDTYSSSYTLNDDGTVATEKHNNSTYTYTYSNVGEDTRAAVPTPFDNALSPAEKLSNRMHGIHNRLHSRHAKAVE